MPDKADRSRPTIALPQGGGAIRSLGETFTPDLFTGTGNFTLPIALPPGRNNGLQPALALSYSTGNGNGAFGLGWTLATPVISRKTSKGVPRYQDDDVLVFNGSEDLVRLPPDAARPTRQRYRPRTESAFASIERLFDTANDFWEVRNTDGTTHVFGTPGGRGSDVAVVGRPDAARLDVFRWHLTQTRDAFDNAVAYGYERDLTTGGSRDWDQLYLSSIGYVDEQTPAGAQAFAVTVEFVYESRADAFSEYRAGFEIRTRRRCRTIRVSTNAGRVVRVRDYDLAYVQDAWNGLSLLSSVTVSAYGTPDTNNAQAREELPPVSFTYTTLEPGKRRFVPVEGTLPAASLANPNFELVDLSGSALPDIVQIDDGVRYWRNRGNGRFEQPRTMPRSPAGLALSRPGVQLVDADGDGRTDLLVSTPEKSGFFPITTEGSWDERLFTPHDSAPSFALDDPDVRLVDLDGDGVVDALRTGRRLECYFNDRTAGWHDTQLVSRQPLDRFPDVAFSDARVRLADMTGDGLQDIVLLHDRAVDFWPNLGHGHWGARVRMSASPHLPFGFDHKRVLLGDVDGDGAADLVYVDAREIRIWINQSGNGFAATPIVVRGTPPVADGDSLRLVDLFGSGTSGILWSTDAATANRKPYWFLDLTGGRKPYLLRSMSNNLGATTTITYRSSTEERLRDEPSPAARWKTPLPFPVQVVSRVDVVDELSGGKLTMAYRYHQGYWDGVEREFRGFGMVEQLDTETFDDYHGRPGTFGAVPVRQFSPPTLRKTWFHLGAIARPNGDWSESTEPVDIWTGDPSVFDRRTVIDQFLDDPGRGASPLPRRARRDALRALRGRILRTELFALDGDARESRPFTVTDQAYGLTEIEPPAVGSDRSRIFFAHATRSRTTQWERGDDPMTSFSETRYDVPVAGGGRRFDAFGRVRQTTTVAMPRRARRRNARGLDETRILATHVTIDYAVPPAGVFIHDRVSESASYELRTPPGLAEADPDSVVSLLRDQAAAAAAVADLFDVPDAATVRLFSHVVNHYDGAAFDGLVTGALGTTGALTRSEQLVFTEDELDAYGDRRPDYLGGALARPAEAPSDIATSLGYRLGTTPLGTPGYYTNISAVRITNRGVVDAWRDALGGEGSVTYDQWQWLVESERDPMGNVSTAVNDYRTCQPTLTTDANGCRARVTFTPAGLPAEVWTLGRADRVEGSRTRPAARFEYDFRAFMNSAPGARRPSATRTIRYVRDDTDAAATPAERDDTLESRVYSDGFGRSLQLRAQGEDVVFGALPFGGGDTVLPESTAATPPATVTGTTTPDPSGHVVVSGWQTYDNKGRIVERFEPSFTTGWDYRPPAATERGQRIAMTYDALGRLLRTTNPDGSEARFVYGIPAALDTPESATPTPWETYTYDANDLAPLSRHPTRVNPDGSPAPLTGEASLAHHFTPSSGYADALGRQVASVQRNGRTSADELVTRTTYDIRGNVLSQIDPLGREVIANVYDLLDCVSVVRQLDGGLRSRVYDAASAEVETRDSKGGLVVNSYDAARRLVNLWARDDDTQGISERQRIEYVDTSVLRGFTIDEARDANCLGRVWRHYDEAGVVEFQTRDVRGNLTAKSRRVVTDAAIAGGWRAAWNTANAGQALSPIVYTTTTVYDALLRQLSLTCPDPTGAPTVMASVYNRAGMLQSIRLNGTPIVRSIAYNAKAQRVVMYRGNGLLTRYAYDTRTFRVRRVRTEAAAEVGADYVPSGAAVHDVTYEHDLVGNLVRSIEWTAACGVRNNADSARWMNTNPSLAARIVAGDALVREFTFDALYRLLSATGRESTTIAEPRPWADYSSGGYLGAGAVAPDPANAPDITSPYAERYAWDNADNLISIAHDRDAGATSWVRRFGMGGLTPSNWDQAWRARLTIAGTWANAPGNRATHVNESVVPAPPTHQFDPNGNMIQELTDRQFAWNHANVLTTFTVSTGPGATPSVDARYLYGADGRRVKKWVRRNGVAASDESTVYIDGVFEHHQWTAAGVARQNTLTHVVDTQSRVAIVRTGPAHPRDAGPAVQYHLGDHLTSSAFVVGGATAADAVFLNREEYFPFGETSFGSFGRKRYRFCGRERDEESGMHYHGARFYVPWISRWLSPDPAGTVDGLNLYRYCRGNPIGLWDPTGMGSWDSEPAPDAATSGATDGGTTIKEFVPPPAKSSPHKQTLAQPPSDPSTPVVTKTPDVLRAKILATSNAVWDSEKNWTIDAKTYKDTWKKPAMNNLLDGLPPSIEADFRSKIDAGTLATLNIVSSPTTQPVNTQQNARSAWEISCVAPIVGDECKAAMYSTGPDGTTDMSKNNFVSARKADAGQPGPKNEVTSNIYDAFGHCYDGCRIAQVCGPDVAVRWGREREAWREAGYGGAHDSFPQDSHNEARGLLMYLADPKVDCKKACTEAVDSFLDLSAPPAQSR